MNYGKWWHDVILSSTIEGKQVWQLEYQNKDSIRCAQCMGSRGEMFYDTKKWSYFNYSIKGEFERLEKEIE